jgi:hypothetical protein
MPISEFSGRGYGAARHFAVVPGRFRTGSAVGPG